MKLRHRYLALCVLGTVLPYWKFLPWLRENGLDLPLFARELFVNRISFSFAMDVLISAVVVCIFARVEGRRLGMRGLWMPVVAVFFVGVSLALPLFLYLRQVELDRAAAPARA